MTQPPPQKAAKEPLKSPLVEHLIVPFDGMLCLAVCGKLLKVAPCFVHKLWTNCRLATTLRRRFLAYFFLPL